MKVDFRRSFIRDLKKIRDNAVLEKIRKAIERVERVQDMNQIEGLAKLSGAYGYYRLRIGDYRIGIVAHGDIVQFVRCLHRRDIYRYFPP
ncbi:MAG: type II toxin-antitoxin system RelE family toxin [Methylococcales bacterium]